MGEPQVKRWYVEKNAFGAGQPPKQLRLTAPEMPHQYPVLIFQHGTSMYTAWYSTILDHVASRGYVVIAPQMYTICPPKSTDANEEILEAAAVIHWISSNQDKLGLPLGVTLDFDKLALAGHSRGAKVAVALARKLLNTDVTMRALAALDPVDGPKNGNPIAKDTRPSEPATSECSTDHSVDLGVPALLFGSGLGGSPTLGGLAGPCAPAALGYAQFFRAFKSTTYQFVAKDYGHMDILDGKKEGCPSFSRFKNCLATKVCPGCGPGRSRGELRSYLGDLLVAFLDSSLKNKPGGLEKLRVEWESAPIAVEQPKVYASPSSEPGRGPDQSTSHYESPTRVLEPASV
ncbi:Chlorophyllase [Klebsormidium nitens]|uniref:Chlorophyllase n=1 Tax=Klebsormidium nitens TaxID=105231 RepID=A0A1Y1IKH7_KLENI|nr:Chlorophyllase [Klebsormidium nitens]|eukprot:GAQ89266.1 Chlorophyllase [Klebsormidium nitens]